MLRIALIIALLTAGGALVVSQFVIKPKVVQLNDDLTSTKATLDTTQTAKAKAEAELKKTQTALDAVGKELNTTKTERDAAQEEAQKQTARADKLQTDLTGVTKSRNEAQQELAQWQALGITPAQVRQVQADLQKSLDQRSELELVIKDRSKEIVQLNARLKRYEQNVDVPIEMPGLKGTVAAVDGQWGFVVLDQGGENGAKEGGVVIVSRGDKLIGKARILTVEPKRSIANVLTDWKQGDVAVASGDKFFY